MVKIILFGDIKRRVGKQSIELKGDRPLIEVLRELAEMFGIEDILFRDGKLRGELLVLVNGADWNSLGYINNVVPDDAQIKLIPVWHGG